MQYVKKSENKIYAYLLFLIWPFLSIFFAFYDYRKTWAKNIVWFFVAFYGYTMVISGTGMDANSYRDQFIEESTSNTTTNVVTDIYGKDSDNLDLLKPLLNKVVSSFTDDYTILFLVYGLIFGYFFSRNIWLLFESSNQTFLKIGIPILVVFIFINPFWNINGFRFYTAAQIFVYGCLLYLIKGKKRGVLLLLSTVFVHFTFILPITVFFIYMFFGNRLTIYFYFFVISLFISELNLEMVRNNLFFLPDVVVNRVDSYVSEEYKEQIMESLKNYAWYAKYRIAPLKYSIYVFLVYLYWKRHIFFKNNKELYSLFSFLLLFFGFSNIVASVPSAGRFLVISFSMSIALTYLCLQFLNDKLLNSIIKISIPALIFFLIVTIRMGFYTISLTTLLGNPIIALFMENDLAIENLIK